MRRGDPLDRQWPLRISNATCRVGKLPAGARCAPECTQASRRRLPRRARVGQSGAALERRGEYADEGVACARGVDDLDLRRRDL